jgi:rRNA maturation RNase YbeY
MRRRERSGHARPPRVDPPVRSKKPSAGRIEVSWDRVARIESDAEVRRAVRAARKLGRREDLGLSVVFVSDAQLARLHARHMGDPSHTDVITFDLSDDLAGPAGEIYASVERARKVARARGVPARRELALYVVHGVLHLCGYDDRSRADQTRMRAAEARVLRSLGWSDDTLPHHA